MSTAFPMRRRLFRTSEERAVDLLARAPYVHFASSTPDGGPVLRTVNAVVTGGFVCFHGAVAGEKRQTLGRAVVVSAEDHVAQIPSYFVDPQLACPATTFYRSVQAHGVLELIDDPERKAAVLSALMRKHQPEGGYLPITTDNPDYAKALAGIHVVGVRLDQVDGKEKLGQNRTPDELCRLLENLWRRGESGDLRAIELVREANPEAPLPVALRGPEGFRAHVSLLEEARAEEAAALLEGAYWLPGMAPADVARLQRASNAFVGLTDENGALVASARAISDELRTAWIYDVIVSPAHRGNGLGQALVRLVLDHPSVRHAQYVRLGTRDAMTLYARFGFEVTGVSPAGATEMILRRPREHAAAAKNGTAPASVQR